MLSSEHERIRKRMKEAEMHFQENDGWLHRVENEVKLLKSNNQAFEVSITFVIRVTLVIFFVISLCS